MSCSCEIKFEDSPRKIVYAGQLLRGTVQLNLAERITVRGVYIRIKGKARAKWGQGRSSVDYKEKYLDKEVYLLEQTSGEYFVHCTMNNCFFVKKLLACPFISQDKLNWSPGHTTTRLNFYCH